MCYLDAQARLIGAHLDAHALVHIRAGPKNAGTLGPTPHSTPYRALPQENFERNMLPNESSERRIVVEEETTSRNVPSYINIIEGLSSLTSML